MYKVSGIPHQGSLSGSPDAVTSRPLTGPCDVDRGIRTHIQCHYRHRARLCAWRAVLDRLRATDLRAPGLSQAPRRLADAGRTLRARDREDCRMGGERRGTGGGQPVPQAETDTTNVRKASAIAEARAPGHAQCAKNQDVRSPEALGHRGTTTPARVMILGGAHRYGFRAVSLLQRGEITDSAAKKAAESVKPRGRACKRRPPRPSSLNEIILEISTKTFVP